MDIIIELIICAIIIFGAVAGLRRGLVGMAAKPVKLIAALVIAFNFCGMLAETAITPLIQEPIASYVTDYLYEHCADITSENIMNELPTFIRLAASLVGINIEELAQQNTTGILEAVVDNLVTPVINVVSVVISFILIYVVARILIAFILLLIKGLFRGGVLGLVNKILGLVCGLIVAILAAWAVCAVIGIVFNLPAFDSNAMISEFEGGFFYKFFREHNPIEMLLSF